MTTYRDPPLWTLAGAAPRVPLPLGATDSVILSAFSTAEEVEDALAIDREARPDREAHARAVAAPCPAFAIGPDLRPPRNPRPPKDHDA